MKTPILETERLILRPLYEKDAQEIYQNWASDPEVAKYMIWNTHQNVEVTRAWLFYVEKNIDEVGIYDWGFVRKSDQVLIGSGVLYYKEDRGMFSLGYNIMKACWKQGYASEAAARMVQFATEELHQQRLFACHAKDNPNSGRVMEKIGFCYTNDTGYDNMDGTKHFEAKEYLFEISK